MNNFTELKDWQQKYGFKPPDKKLRVYYSAVAFSKTIQLVQAHSMEVGWNMVVKPYKDGYKVFDICVYPQKVSAAFVSVDLAKYGMWKASLDDDTEANLFGQSHSHVNMAPYPSVTDDSQQHDEIIGKQTGFYLYQIWNKRCEVNSFFYDLDNMVWYTANDIDLIVEYEVNNCENSLLFLSDSFRKVKIEIKEAYEVGEDFESEQII